MSAASATPASDAVPLRGQNGRLRACDRQLHATDGWQPAGLAGAAAVEEQRFVAYAAHELLGELALQRALAEVALADPNADTAALRQMGARVVVACERQQEVLEAMLTLFRGTCGHRRREPVDLAATAAEVLRTHDHRGLRRAVVLEPARTTGEVALIERLVSNLVANAIRHNVAGGRVDIRTGTVAGRAVFTIANTGPVIAAGELVRLFRPFERLRAGAGPSASGVGLGLSIVESIAAFHDATVAAQPRSGGGLEIAVAFPAVPPKGTERSCVAAVH